MKTAFQVVGQSLANAAATAIYLASSEEVVEKGQKGKYFIPIATEDKTSKLAEDKDMAKNLWYWCDDKATKGSGALQLRKINMADSVIALGRGWDMSPSEKAKFDMDSQ